MPVFACSGLAVRRQNHGMTDPGQTWIRHTAFIVECVSREEAVGRALSIVLKLYPAAQGWASHDVQVSYPDPPPLTVETAVLRE